MAEICFERVYFAFMRAVFTLRPYWLQTVMESMLPHPSWAALSQPSVTDWMQAWAQIVTAVVTVLLLLTLVLTRRQVKLTREQIESAVRWNRINATFTFFSTEQLAKPERAMVKSLQKLGINYHQQLAALTARQLEAICGNAEVLIDVKEFLNMLDDYATAVRSGALDADTAFAMMRYVVSRHYRTFKPFIQRRRRETDDQSVYCELEGLAEAWLTRAEEERRREGEGRRVTQRV